MKVGGVPYRAIFTGGDGRGVRVIDQTLLPHRFETVLSARPCGPRCSGAEEPDVSIAARY